MEVSGLPQGSRAAGVRNSAVAVCFVEHVFIVCGSLVTNASLPQVVETNAIIDCQQSQPHFVRNRTSIVRAFRCCLEAVRRPPNPWQPAGNEHVENSPYDKRLPNETLPKCGRRQVYGCRTIDVKQKQA